jgi:chorismate dehydratase
MESTLQASRPYSFGVVPYMNAIPLVHCLSQVAPRSKLIQHVPRHLAGLLLDNTLDAGLVPIVDVFANPDLQILTDIGIAATGPVQSVLIISRTTLEDIRTIRLNPESRTSNALAILLMKHHFHHDVSFVKQGDDLNLAADAEVVIGDKALQRRGTGLWECDLSDAWYTMTGLPFVFAVWATRGNHPHLSELAGITQEALRRGQTEIPFIARQQALRLRLPSLLCQNYLAKIIHYNLGPNDKLAVSRFNELNSKLITPSGAIA